MEIRSWKVTARFSGAWALAARAPDDAQITTARNAALRAAIAPYLAIARVRALVGPVGSPAVREQLIRQVEATLHAS